MRFVADFIGALREAGLPVSPAESLDALKAIQLLGLDSRETCKNVLALTLVKRQDDQEIYEELFDLYFTGVEKAKEADQGDSEPSEDLLAAQKDAGNGDDSAANASSALGQALIQKEDMSLAIAQAAVAEKLSTIVLFTQKNHFAYKIMQRLGDEALSAEIHGVTNSPEPKNSPDPKQKKLQRELIKSRARLLDQVKDYVEQQHQIFAQHKGQKYREDFLQQAKLSQLDRLDYKLMQTLVRRAARKLAAQHSRRRLTRKRGQLDVRKTIAANAAFDGALFHTRWKATRVERPKVVAICDVSGSVSRVARFLLLFLYSLQDVMPKVRSFVFASDMVEVTELFKQQEIELALEEIMKRWGGLSTDYAKALSGFQSQALASIDKKTTVIMLGDARNNQGDGRVDIWEQVFRKSKRVLWLNPEQRNSWDSGDSIMSEYLPWCSSAEPCRNLKDIERIFSRILKYS
ncbi:vWA domain-containing protein [Paraglaciecola arctica]|uniref:VWA containing CoxE-like protein n=1 Tax=Paraglaciecola arctica BSs20135 TaxID=493475 RepID=K6YLX3_9ALTE|nr:VWA domain-containing protein [Paraglaciecola arctica]GAC17643.1 VWA containing CoxE-like protein [Paraglaciecola arctica BSs20135]